MTAPFMLRKFLFPVLNVLNDGKEHSLKNLMDDMAHIFSLSDAEVEERGV